ncbi:PTS sugar transporter subunit IIC [Thermophilibacter mediterraneus]|uniref:PTS sugar transporter subunit IIC n=2 Tax=Thermophilibacter TaxID=2847307 RepID=UPI00093072DF|nr:PTS transporter subunit EIIC [Thermophilibacter mediterraneus]
MLDKFTDLMERILTPVADFMNGNKYVVAIQKAFTTYTPIVITGSFAFMLNLMLCSTSSGLAQFAGFEWLANYANIFSTVNYACISCMALWIAFLVAYSIGEQDGQKPLICGLISVVCFITVLDPENIAGSLDASALFLAFFVGIGSMAIFNGLMRFERIKIKLPESVPEMIANSFNALIPAFITIMLFGVFAGVLYAATGTFINSIIYTVIQIPFNQAIGTQIGVSIITVLSQLLWWMGIHGHMAMNAVAKPVRTAALAANIAAVASGALPPEFYTLAFVHLFMNLGGSGIVISLALAILAFSKRADYREVTKLSFVPLLFGISEPMVFGLPIMLNPTFFFPFVLVPLVTCNIGYYAITSGFLTSAYVESIAGAPMFLQQFLAFSGQWQALLMVVVVIAVAFVLYVPFVLVSNKQYEREQAEAAKIEA